MNSEIMEKKFNFKSVRNHMAMLRNLRNITQSGVSKRHVEKVCQALIESVPYGKQFPFRYYTAYQAVGSVNHSGLLKDTLEECLDISVSNLPKLKGKTICLSDNSGSAHGSMTSEYGTVSIAEIGNLSSIVTSLQSDEGEVGVFGDRLSMKPASTRNGILSQLTETNNRGRQQGMGTENGVWLFFRDAIENKTHYDNIFIYSDQQCAHGGLFGENEEEYKDYIYEGNHYGRHIDVLKLVQKYRKTVNPKVNIFTVQTAGYNNSVVPENIFRGSVLTGWTGKESQFAKSLIDAWDQVETKVPIVEEVTQ